MSLAVGHMISNNDCVTHYFVQIHKRLQGPWYGHHGLLSLDIPVLHWCHLMSSCKQALRDCTCSQTVKLDDKVHIIDFGSLIMIEQTITG